MSEEFEAKITPMRYMEYQGLGSVYVGADLALQDIFATRTNEGFEGNGYDWTSLAQVFLAEKYPDLERYFGFDPEADTFAIHVLPGYPEANEALKKFALAFRAAWEDRELMLDLLSRAELD